MPIRKPDEDLFEESRMSFGEHLEELRRVIVRSLYGVAIACILGFYMANGVVKFLQKPLTEAIADFKIKQAAAKIVEQTGYLAPELRQRMISERMVPSIVQIDAGEFIKAIKEAGGPGFEKFDVTPYRYGAHEIQKDSIGDLANYLLGEAVLKENEEEQKRALFESLLTEENRTVLKSLAKRDSFGDQQVTEMISVLDDLIDQPAVHQSDAFEAVLAKPTKGFWSYFQKEKDDTLHLMKVKFDETKDADLSRRLNHLLLSQVFQKELNPATVRMSEIQMWQKAEVNPQSLTAPEVFMIWVKAGIITGLFIASPWVFYQIWSFVAVGLYKHEQRYVYIYLPFSLILFFAGAALSFFFVFKPVLSFLFEFNAGMGIDPQPRIGDWLSFVMFLPLGFGIAFQLPLVMLMLNRIGLFEVSVYTAKWRAAVLVIFVLSMFLTPADPISLVMLAVPLTFLYFFGIGLCIWMPRGRNPFGEVYEP